MVFDSFLLKLASGLDNITVFTGTAVKGISIEGEGVTVATAGGSQITSKLLSAATETTVFQKNRSLLRPMNF
jgi:2-polyprenyl-6-methoxyphenol hydroxylase-like FAD-dependent oxidoreductase